MNLEVDLPDDRTSSAREVVLRYLKAMAETYSRNWVYDWSRTDWGNPFVKIQIQVMVDHELIRKRKLGAEELATDPGHWGIYDQRMIKGAKALSPSWILGPCGADVKTTWRSGCISKVILAVMSQFQRIGSPERGVGRESCKVSPGTSDLSDVFWMGPTSPLPSLRPNVPNEPYFCPDLDYLHYSWRPLHPRGMA